MKIVIDTSPLKSGHAHRGVGSYTRSLVEALRFVDPDNEYILTSQPQHIKSDLIHYPYFDYFFHTLPLFINQPTVVTIHDTIPLIYPNHYPRGVRGELKFLLQKKSLNRVSAIITDSDTSQRDIIKLLKQPENKVHRVYLAADKAFVPAPKEFIDELLSTYDIQKPYFLYVGDVNFNKNLPALLTAYAQIKSNYQLVLVSRALKNPIPESKEILSLLETLHLNHTVKILTNISLDPKDELCGLYSGASWYIQPSLYEGFGLPVLEAWSCGTPVITSRGGSLEEIVADAGITFDPTDLTSIVNALKTTVSMKEAVRKDYILKGKTRNKDFLWQKTATETIAIYRQCLGM